MLWRGEGGCVGRCIASSEGGLVFVSCGGSFLILGLCVGSSFGVERDAVGVALERRFCDCCTGIVRERAETYSVSAWIGRRLVQRVCA